MKGVSALLSLVFVTSGLVLPPDRTMAGDARGATPEIRVELSTPAYFDTHNLGANGDGEMRFGLRLMNGVTAEPPTTITTTLPEGITFVNYNSSRFNCAAVGQALTCTYLWPLSASQPSWNVRVRVDVAGDIPVPGESTIRLIREHALVPAPDPVVCASVPDSGGSYSDTGCVERTVAHRQSMVYFEQDGWSHHPHTFLAGSEENLIETQIYSQGFTSAHGPLLARFLLPPGFVFNRGGPNGYWGCVGSTPDSTGQLVTCTYLLNNHNITTHPWLRVDMAADVPVPGPHLIIATVSNPFQPPPDDFATCLEAEPPIGCSVYEIGTALPPMARMEITQMGHQPALLVPDQQGRIYIAYTNSGPGIASDTVLDVAAPPGFSFTAATNANPSVTCHASGDAATGQTVRCTSASTFGVGQHGQLWLDFQIAWAGTTQGVVTASIHDATNPSPALDACELDHDQAGCGMHIAAISDALFCDRFEDPNQGCPNGQ